MPNNDMSDVLEFAESEKSGGRESARSKFSDEVVSSNNSSKKITDVEEKSNRGNDIHIDKTKNQIDWDSPTISDLNAKNLQGDQIILADSKDRHSFYDGNWHTLKSTQPTPEEIKEAKEKLEKEVSKLIPEAERKTLVAMQNALLDGNATEFDKLVKGFKGKPEELAKFVEEIEKNLKEAGAGVHLAVSGEGKVIVYKDKTGTAVEFSPEGGTPKLRPVSTKFDGTVVLEPGEVLGKKAEDVMKGIGNAAINNIEHPFSKEIIQFPIYEPSLQWPDHRWPNRYNDIREFDSGRNQYQEKGSLNDFGAEKYRFLNPKGKSDAEKKIEQLKK